MEQEHMKIDVWGTAEKLQEKGYSVYDMVLMATARAREINKKRDFLDTQSMRLNKYPTKAINQALIEIEQEANN